MKKHLQRLLALILAVTMVTLMAPGAFAATITRGEFIAEITSFFGWPHWDEYNDIWKDDPKTFDDIVGGPYQKAIETALEEGVVGPVGHVGKRTTSEDGKREWGVDVVGSFNPNDPITREGAADMLARAWKLDTASGGLSALTTLGINIGAGAPADQADRDVWLGILNTMKTSVVAPVYFVPRPTEGLAPRRNIKLYTANPAAEIYVSRNTNGSLTTPPYEAPVADPVKNNASRYSEYHNTGNDDPRGYIGYDATATTTYPGYKYPVIKAIAVDPSKTLKPESEVTSGKWKIWRPLVPARFQHELVFDKDYFNPGSPKVYRIFERSDSVLAMAWYVEGTEKAFVNDALNLSRTNAENNNIQNLRDYVVEHVVSNGHPAKTAPLENLYLVIGHTDVDHFAQTYSFDGHYVYGGRRSRSSFNGQITEPNRDRITILDTGDTLDIGGCVLNVYSFPNHNSNSIVLHDKVSGLVFGSDIMACVRAGSADDVAISSANSTKSDVFLSVVQQSLDAMRSNDGKLSWVFTGHDDYPLPAEPHFEVLMKALQLMIDEGEANVQHPTYRQVRRGANLRSVTYGNIYPDSPSGLMPKPITQAEANALQPGDPTPTMSIPDYRRYRNGNNWVTFATGGNIATTGTIAASAGTTMSSPAAWNPIEIDYNILGNHIKYSQLSNVQFIGAELVGVTFNFGATTTDPETTNSLHNMFYPWVYNYTIKVPGGTTSIDVIPTTMSTNVTSLKLNGIDVAGNSRNTVDISAGKVITIDVVAGDGVTASKYEFTVVKAIPTAAGPADNSESNQLLNTGYFFRNLTGELADREVRVYIPDTAVLRPYYHFIAIPDDADVNAFLVESGWMRIADETGECLFVLLPKDKKWGSLADELEYMRAAHDFHINAPMGTGGVLSIYGDHYLVGYGAGAAALEAWAAETPDRVISQAYIGATSDGQTLADLGAQKYSLNHMGDGDRTLDSDGNHRMLVQMADRLKDVLNGDGRLLKSDMPIPTWHINAANTEGYYYWRAVNRANASPRVITSFGNIPVSGVEIDQTGDTWGTEYSGRISKVVTINTLADTASYEFSKEVRKALTKYTRYDTSIAYGNALTLRLDYSHIAVDRFSPARDTLEKKDVTGRVEGVGADNLGAGEITLKLLSGANSANTAVSDMLLYVPDTAVAKHVGGKIPVVNVWHGASQTAQLFFDSTAWWMTAAREGFALVYTTRTTQGTGANAPQNNPLFDAINAFLASDGRFDMGRIYITGQSAGSNAAIALAMDQDRVEKIAAVFSHNSPSSTISGMGKPIPAGFICGDGNYAFRGIPGYDNEADAKAAGFTDIHWYAANFNGWVNYFAASNGVEPIGSVRTAIEYFNHPWAVNGGVNKQDGSAADWLTNNARYRKFVWNNNRNIPVMTWIVSMYNAHNNLQGYNPLLWDFMEHFSIDANGVRYYSPSAFVNSDDLVVLGSQHISPPVITTTALQDGMVGTAYSETLVATGGDVINWVVDIGNLPGGLSLSSGGVITGAPTSAGEYNFTVKATNPAGTDTKALSIKVVDKPVITTTSLPRAEIGKTYSQTLTATSDIQVTWSIDSGSLPGGLLLSSGGAISGNPTTSGAFSFTVKATNLAGSDTKALSIVVYNRIIPPEGEKITLPGLGIEISLPGGATIDENGVIGLPEGQMGKVTTDDGMEIVFPGGTAIDFETGVIKLPEGKKGTIVTPGGIAFDIETSDSMLTDEEGTIELSGRATITTRNGTVIVLLSGGSISDDGSAYIYIEAGAGGAMVTGFKPFPSGAVLRVDSEGNVESIGDASENSGCNTGLFFFPLLLAAIGFLSLVTRKR
ncbi:MAG: cadherin-like beta sandwich domain-containing protein [Oscillospiraceae bacterium]|nr:cadherin-like beta sandwich domain-containing protein [Oscillospiraceae bacterium]